MKDVPPLVSISFTLPFTKADRLGINPAIRVKSPRSSSSHFFDCAFALQYLKSLLLLAANNSSKASSATLPASDLRVTAQLFETQTRAPPDGCAERFFSPDAIFG